MTENDIFQRQAQMLKALAHKSRLKILERLGRGECSVGELTDLIGSDPSTVSKHLALLRAHGIVIDRREGNVVYYKLLTPCVLNFFSCATQLLKERSWRHVELIAAFTAGKIVWPNHVSPSADITMISQRSSARRVLAL